jgi:hypothetical protein
MELPEQTKKLPINTRRELLENIANSQTGQALREELVDIMNDVGNISNELLSSEVRGMRRAKSYIQGIYSHLLPVEEEKTEKKTHK